MKPFNFDSYGAFKESSVSGSDIRASRIARALGMKNRYLKFLKNARRDQPVVELGCGNGGFIRDMLGDGFALVSGVDPSPTYLPVVNPDLLHCEAAQPYLESLTPASVGTIVALDVFEHIEPDALEGLLKMIESRLVPEGLLIFRVPNMASPMGLANYFGDLSHVTPLTETSIRQLLFGAGLAVRDVCPEPFAYPRSISTVLGIALWPFYVLLARAGMAAFGIREGILTPNLVCIAQKKAEQPPSG